jgi:signal transduction histidine kinase
MLLRKRAGPLAYAAVLAASYAFIFILYIVISGQIARSFAQSEAELQRIEMMKGVFYGIFSSCLLFAGSLHLFRRLAINDANLKIQQDAATKAQRHAVTGLLTMSIAHDCNNLVLILSSAVQMLNQEAALQGRPQDLIHRIDSTLKVLREMLSRLHRSGREVADGQPKTIQLDQEIRDAVALVRSHHSFKQTELSLSVESALTAKGFAILIQQMIINLVVNACEATEGKGILKVSAWREAQWAVIEIHDNGPGVSPETRQALFVPYYSTKEHGLGLGLVSVRACVDSNGGDLAVTDSPLGGACFRVKIPLTAA